MSDNVYIHAFSLPSANAESGFFAYRDERMYDTLYPFQIFPYKQLRTVEFAPQSANAIERGKRLAVF